MTHTDAKVEFVHMHALEYEGKEIHDGALEIVRETDGRIMAQISSGDMCARAWIPEEEMTKIALVFG